MSTTKHQDETDTAASTPRLLTEDNEISRGLSGSRTLLIRGRLGEAEPFAVRLLDPDEHVVASESFTGSALGNDVERQRFAARAEDMSSEDSVAGEIDVVLQDVAEEYATADLVVLDEWTRKLVDSTERVEHDPDAFREWTIYLRDRKHHGDLHTVRVSDKGWSKNPAANLDTQIPSEIGQRFFGGVRRGDDHDDRWLAVRQIWESMAAESRE